MTNTPISPESTLDNLEYERMPANELGFVLIGPSGVGKTTLRDYICSSGSEGENYVKYLPLTTRQKRPGEDGEYRFVSMEEMEKAKASLNAIFGNLSYGNEFLTLWPEKLPDNSKYLYIYLPDAAKKLKEAFPQTKIIQIVPSDASVLEDRILSRDSTINSSELAIRLRSAEQELHTGALIADAVVVNDDSIDEVGSRLHGILRQLAE